FIVMYSNRIVMRLAASDWLMQSVAMTSIARRAINAEAHIIIAGYGRSGQNLARLLDGERIPYMALDLDPDRVRQAAAAGQSVVFGDAARLQSVTLPAAGSHLGQTLAAQALHAVGVTVVSVRRASGAVTKPDDGIVLAAGDTLVLSGLPEPLALAESRLLGKKKGKAE